jgi:hypothetical protein
MNELPLRDIHLPDASLWWPPAIGWWFLPLGLVLIAFYLPKLVRWLKQKPVKKLSLRELKRIRSDLKSNRNEHQALQELSVLLRRTVMSYCGRNSSASLTGASWVQQLQQLSVENYFSAEQSDWLSYGQYQPAAKCEVKALMRSCENWIRALPRNHLHVAN